MFMKPVKLLRVKWQDTEVLDLLEGIYYCYY